MNKSFMQSPEFKKKMAEAEKAQVREDEAKNKMLGRAKKKALAVKMTKKILG